MAKTAGWRFSLGVVMVGSTLAIGGCADSMSGGAAMTDKGVQPMTDKSMMGKDQGMPKDQGMMKDQGMPKDGAMQDSQGTMEKK
ncbi:MAG TPA: hypothetical protein VMS64_35140 [Candidatus Methylomirabilis sp.]|nr:hypothetical protein [Candidatus Methylomirabilis sp.]